jgi:hypothetical protein
MTAPISEAVLDAAETYARHVETATTARNGMSGAVAVDRVRRARAALDRRQVAILDMVAVTGHDRPRRRNDREARRRSHGAISCRVQRARQSLRK